MFLRLFIVIAASRHVNKNVSEGAVTRVKSGTQRLAFINYWLTLKPVKFTSYKAYERLVRNPILPSRVYERTQTQSTQA